MLRGVTKMLVGNKSPKVERIKSDPPVQTNEGVSHLRAMCDEAYRVVKERELSLKSMVSDFNDQLADYDVAIKDLEKNKIRLEEKKRQLENLGGMSEKESRELAVESSFNPRTLSAENFNSKKAMDYFTNQASSEKQRLVDKIRSEEDAVRVKTEHAITMTKALSVFKEKIDEVKCHIKELSRQLKEADVKIRCQDHMEEMNRIVANGVKSAADAEKVISKVNIEYSTNSLLEVDYD